MQTKSLWSRKVQLAFGSGIFALFFVGGISYRFIVISTESDRWVRQTHEVLEKLQALLITMQSLDLSYRGFLLSGRESYLETCDASIVSAHQELMTIRQETSDNSAQQLQIPALETLLSQKIQSRGILIGLRQEKGLLAAADAIQGRPRQRSNDEFQGVIRGMHQEEQRLLVIREADATRRLNQTQTILILGTLMGLLIATAAGWSVQRDSSRRELAEEALQESEYKYHRLIQGVQDYAILMLGPKGEIRSWNPGAERMTGCKYEEVAGQNFSRFFTEEDIEQGRPEEILRLAAVNDLYEEQGTRVRKDGSRFQARTTFTTSRDTKGNLRGFSVISRDLTQSTGSEAQYRGLLEAAPDPMVVVNQAGEIVLVNLQAEKQLGYHRDELVGQEVKNIIPKGFAELLIADGSRTAAEALAQQVGTGIELTARRKDGGEFPIEIMLSPFESTEGILAMAAIRDITTRKKDEAILLHKVEELNRSNEELGQFAYIASHDLQEPLRMVASYMQLLSMRYKGKLDADADDFISFAVDGASRMQRLIQDLLAFSQVGTKGQDLLDTSSEESLAQAIVNLRGAIEASGAQVTHDPLPNVLADDMQLTQLFQNLIGNGIKYQNPGIPRIHISAAKNGGKKWTFSVRDNGLGIDPQHFERIFGMFQRLHKREEFAGTGIGLAICKKIVERHGSNITVESQLGHGSTFSFALAGSELKS